MQFLIVTHDAVTEGILAGIAGEMKAFVEFRGDTPSGRAALERQRYDLVVIDCDDVYQGEWLLRSARKSRANRSSVLVAITNGGTNPADALDLGADLILAKPLIPDQARIQMQRVCQAVTADQRNVQRHPVQMPIFLSFGEVIDRCAETFNVSTGGIGVRVTEPIQDDDMVHLRFRLPGCATAIHARGEIAWADCEGNAGIKFMGMNPEHQRLLAEWLEDVASRQTSHTSTMPASAVSYALGQPATTGQIS